MRLQKVFNNIIAKLSYNEILKVIRDIDIHTVMILGCIGYAIGAVLYVFNKIEYFFIIQAIGVVVFGIALISMKKYLLSIKKMKKAASGKCKISVPIGRLKRRVYSSFNIIPGIIVGSFYVWLAIRMDLVEYNPIGYYCLFALFLVCFLIAIALLQYIFLLVCLNKISNKKHENYDKRSLAKTKWFTTIEWLSNYYRNRFFILGTMMVIVFIIFSPLNTLEIVRSGYGSYYLFIPIVFYWIIIVFLVIVFLPISSRIRDKAIDRIVLRYNKVKIKNYEKHELGSSSYETYKYLTTIEIINKHSENFISKNNKKLIPLLTTSLNFISITIAMAADLKDLFT